MSRLTIVIIILWALCISTYTFFYYDLGHFKNLQYGLIFRFAKPLILSLLVAYSIFSVKKHNQGVLSFSKGMFTAFVTVLIFSISGSIFYAVGYYSKPNNYNEPAIMAYDAYIKSIPTKEEHKIDKQQLKQSIENQFKPGGYVLPNLIGNFVTGVFAGLIITTILYSRTKNYLP